MSDTMLGQTELPLKAVRDATVSTLSVDVKVIRIGTRQMSQSVFRQLPMYGVVNLEECKLSGPVWGRVNYFWDGCCNCRGPHLHIVWQHGGELCRCGVDFGLASDFIHDRERVLSQLAFLGGMRAALAGAPHKVVRPRDDVNGRKEVLEIGGWRFEVLYHVRTAVANFFNPSSYCGDALKNEALATLKKGMQEIEQRVLGGRELVAAYREEHARLERVEAWWKETWSVLNNSDQLFIAV